VIKCPFCQATHVANTLFCSECGNYLLQDEGRQTDPLDTAEMSWVETPAEEEADISLPHPLVADSKAQAIQLIIGAKKRQVEVPLDKAIHLGRVDPASNVFPEVYISNEDDAAKSVSRRHARIMRQSGTVVVEDLASVNGTFLNGKRLDPYLPEPLNDRDTLYLGKVMIEVRIIDQ
jgi:pSer/pThr/pTyr-binding forkhead associated (FHA) protein